MASGGGAKGMLPRPIRTFRVVRGIGAGELRQWVRAYLCKEEQIRPRGDAWAALSDGGRVWPSVRHAPRLSRHDIRLPCSARGLSSPQRFEVSVVPWVPRQEAAAVVRIRMTHCIMCR